MLKVLAQPHLKIFTALLCFLLAGLVWALTRQTSGTLDDVPEDAVTWTLCVACEHSEIMSLRDFFSCQQQEMLGRHNSMAIPMIQCARCGQKRVVRALKCDHCGHIFEEGAIRCDFYDRCPKCHFSAIENRRTQSTPTP